MKFKIFLFVLFTFCSIQSAFSFSYMYVPIPSKNIIEVFEVPKGGNPVTTISVPNPRELAASSDGKRLYAISNNNLLVIDTANFKIIKTITFPTTPKSVAASFDNSKFYVATAGNVGNCGGVMGQIALLSIFDSSNNQALKEFQLCDPMMSSPKSADNPYLITSNETGDRIYVVSDTGTFLIYKETTVSKIFIATVKAIATTFANEYVTSSIDLQGGPGFITVYKESSDPQNPLKDSLLRKIILKDRAKTIQRAEPLIIFKSGSVALIAQVPFYSLADIKLTSSNYDGGRPGICGPFQIAPPQQILGIAEDVIGLTYILRSDSNEVCGFKRDFMSPEVKINLSDKPYPVRGKFIERIPPTPTDRDGDRVPDMNDNCPDIFNPNQEDADMNGIGDICEPPPMPSDDRDGDGIKNGMDNCPDVSNPGQEDKNQDFIGDACQDTDGDGINNDKDNCPEVNNPGQEDTNPKSGIGDVCEDTDGDSITNDQDNCVYVRNPAQEDTNPKDGIGDACETRKGEKDTDGDTVPDTKDNCPIDANIFQEDRDQDGIGDICDPRPDQADAPPPNGGGNGGGGNGNSNGSGGSGGGGSGGCLLGEASAINSGLIWIGLIPLLGSFRLRIFRKK